MIGRVLDRRYRITGRIARGGMATVYEAHDDRLDRIVAVKVMHAGMGESAQDAVFAQRFVGEARAAAKLTHPNVVSVYDQGNDHGTLFLAMELVRGETLRDVIAREAPLPPEQALAYLDPVLSALAAAHRADLVHRDVKPENVLIAAGHERDAHRVKVADFGLARAVTAQTQHTSSGVIIGTVSYIAPELVVEGRSDARADVYSAGVMLYELLTGEKPHAGETPIQVAYKHVHQDVPPPSRRIPGIPAYVDALVARATARDRSLRPADAGVFLRQARMVARALADGVTDDPELVADLAPPATGVASEEPTAVLHAPATSRTARIAAPAIGDTAPTRRAPAGPAPRRRRRWPALLVVLVLLAGAGAAVGLERDHIPFLNGVTVPGVQGMTPGQATAQLESDGLVVAGRESAYSDIVAAGAVVDTAPGTGAHLHHGDSVELVISKGVEEYPVPDLTGRTLGQAHAALKRIKMRIVVRRSWSETVKRGDVIATDPKAGKVLRPGNPVKVLVSKGPQPITIADWAGEPVDRATSALAQQGLVVHVRRRYDDDTAKGVVLGESPGSQHVFHHGDPITLTVSRGPHLVEVPTGLAGHSEATVTHDLEALGFRVDPEDYVLHFGVGLVMKVEDAGESVPYGSTITIYVS